MEYIQVGAFLAGVFYLLPTIQMAILHIKPAIFPTSSIDFHTFKITSRFNEPFESYKEWTYDIEGTIFNRNQATLNTSNFQILSITSPQERTKNIDIRANRCYSNIYREIKISSMLYLDDDLIPDEESSAVIKIENRTGDVFVNINGNQMNCNDKYVFKQSNATVYCEITGFYPEPTVKFEYESTVVDKIDVEMDDACLHQTKMNPVEVNAQRGSHVICRVNSRSCIVSFIEEKDSSIFAIFIGIVVLFAVLLFVYCIALIFLRWKFKCYKKEQSLKLECDEELPFTCTQNNGPCFLPDVSASSQTSSTADQPVKITASVPISGRSGPLPPSGQACLTANNTNIYCNLHLRACVCDSLPV